MITESGCIFCRIVAGELPSTKVYEDDALLAFLDINPVAKGHTLVIPKDHYADQLAAPPEVLAAIARRIPIISKAITSATNAAAFNVHQCNGAAAGQVVFHLHYHIIPRMMGDGAMAPWRHLSYGEGEADILGDDIRARIET